MCGLFAQPHSMTMCGTIAFYEEPQSSLCCNSRTFRPLQTQAGEKQLRNSDLKSERIKFIWFLGKLSVWSPVQAMLYYVAMTKSQWDTICGQLADEIPVSLADVVMYADPINAMMDTLLG